MHGQNAQIIDTNKPSDIRRLGEGMADRGHQGPVVIIGGGIIALDIAYYLSKDRESGASITVVEKASMLCAGASSKANGILGDYGFKSEAESLGRLSWRLHQELADKHDGRTVWGYRDVMVSNSHLAPSLTNAEVALHFEPTLPTWCKNIKNDASVSICNDGQTARVNPKDFCKFLQTMCERRGVRILLDAAVTEVGINQGSLKSVTIKQKNEGMKKIECRSLVIAAGPWSETVLSELFPHSRVRIPSMKPPNSGNYLVVKIPGWNRKHDTNVCHQICLLGQKVDISSRPDGTLYIGGTLSAQEELPELPTDVQPQPQYVEEMKRCVEEALGCSSNDMEILETGRAYRPSLECERPIITQVPLDKLLGVRTDRDNAVRKGNTRGGVYLNVGHGRDGITLGPGSGKVMSELIDGRRPLSADIKGLGIL